MSQTITNFLTNPATGSIDEAGDFDCGVWFDWFCSDKALINRGKALASKVKSIAASDKFNNDECYVFFKNNCPMSGPLYDSFSICDQQSGKLKFWVTPKSGHNGLAEVVSINEVGQAVTLVKGSWKDVKDFFLA